MNKKLIWIILLCCLFESNSFSNRTTALINKEEICYDDYKSVVQPLECRIPRQYYQYLSDLCQIHDVDIFIIGRLFYRESRFKAKAVGKNYDLEGNIISRDSGLGQLNDRYVETIKWKFNNGQEVDFFNPEQNMSISVQMLSWAYKCSGNYFDALCIYNAGIGTWQNNKVKQKTIDYANDILYSSNLYNDYINYYQEYISVIEY
jgi:hypothetical protein